MPHVDEDNLDRAISALRAVRPTDAPMGDSQSLLEEIMNSSTLTEASAPAEAQQRSPRGRRSWLISGGVAAAAAAIAAVVTGGSNPPVASAAEVVAAAADKTQDLSSFNSTLKGTAEGAEWTTTIDVEGNDYRIVSDYQSPEKSGTYDMRYINGRWYSAENGGEWDVSSEESEQAPSLAKASSDLVNAAVKGSTVTEIGQEGDTVLYQVSVDDALLERLLASSDDTLFVYHLYQLKEEPADLLELVVGVDSSSGVLSKVQLSTDDGLSIDQQINTPAKPFEVPENLGEK
jgi:hypothetical protein